MSQDEGDAFASSCEHFEQVVLFLGTDEAMVLEHGALEERLERDSLCRCSAGSSRTILLHEAL